MGFVVLLVGVLRLLTTIVLVVSVAICAPLLLREPKPWHFSLMRILAASTFFVSLLALRGGWLHLTYGWLTFLLLLAASGLNPGGWFRSSLKKEPEQVGPYLFWVSLIGTMLWVRFLGTQ